MEIKLSTMEDLHLFHEHMKNDATFDDFISFFSSAYSVIINNQTMAGIQLDMGFNIHYGKVLDLSIVIVQPFYLRPLMKHLHKVAYINGCNGIIRSKHVGKHQMLLTFYPTKHEDLSND